MSNRCTCKIAGRRNYIPLQVFLSQKFDIAKHIFASPPPPPSEVLWGSKFLSSDFAKDLFDLNLTIAFICIRLEAFKIL